jgi:crotonobetainyl-CoA:carnitine CoA-transferase CaiB-like acyl-CoA transferase
MFRDMPARLPTTMSSTVPDNHRPPAESPSPLKGINVIEIGQALAGPFAGLVMSSLGANVLKVERLEGGDDTRRMGPAFRHGDALNFHSFNHGKRSVAIDLRTEAGRAALDRACAQADIMIHNLRPGVTKALGFSGREVCARHPRLIYCEISAFGHIGPFSQRPGYEPLIQAFSGLSSINGAPEDPPTRMGASVCDEGTGMWTVIGALSMLEERHRTGRGGIVNASLLETALLWAGQKLDAYANTGELPRRHASGHPDFVPYEAFDAADGPFLLCVGNDRLFSKFSEVLRRTDWIDDPRFKTNRDRIVHRVALVAEMNPILRTRPRDEWLSMLADAGVPCAPIRTIPEAVNDAQVQALGLLQDVPGEDFRLTGLPLSFNGIRPPIRRAGPRLGEHNADLSLVNPFDSHAEMGGH